MPALYIVIHTHPREKLCNHIGAVIIGREILIARTRTVDHVVVDIVPPFDGKHHLPTRLQWGWQVDSHHGLIDNVWQGFSLSVCNFFDIESTVKRVAKVVIGKGRQLGYLVQRLAVFQKSWGIFFTDILVELYPQIRQRIGRIVGIGNGFFSVEALGFVIDFDVHHIVSTLLIVCGTRGTTCGSIIIGSRKLVVELTEFVLIGMPLFGTF